MISRKICVKLMWLILLVSVEVFAQVTKPTIAFLPFENKSGFDNTNWQLEKEIPLAFSDSLRNSGLYQTIDFQLLNDVLADKNVRPYHYKKPEILNEIASALEADFLIFGVIALFELNRTNIGDPLLGGFESYNSEMEVTFLIYNRLAGTISAKHSCRSEAKEKDLGLTFVGRPSKNYVSFEALDKMKFNSPEFRQTILGASFNELVASFFNQLTDLVPVEDAQNCLNKKDTFIEAMIVFKRGDEVYFNAGTAEKVSVGGIYPVYTLGDSIIHPVTGQLLGFADKLIGQVKVSVVKDNHLSLAKIIEETEPIKTKDKVWIEKN